MTHVISYVRIVARIPSNQGTEFMGHLWSELQCLLGCMLTQTSPYHPQGNDIVECAHQTINKLLRATLATTHCTEWVDAIPTVQFFINSTPQ